jgi:hypothetical protein
MQTGGALKYGFLLWLDDPGHSTIYGWLYQ